MRVIDLHALLACASAFACMCSAGVWAWGRAHRVAALLSPYATSPRDSERHAALRASARSSVVPDRTADRQVTQGSSLTGAARCQPGTAPRPVPRAGPSPLGTAAPASTRTGEPVPATGARIEPGLQGAAHDARGVAATSGSGSSGSSSGSRRSSSVRTSSARVGQPTREGGIAAVSRSLFTSWHRHASQVRARARVSFPAAAKLGHQRRLTQATGVLWLCRVQQAVGGARVCTCGVLC